MAFVAIHELGGFEEVGFFAFGDGEEAVLVGVDELAWLDFSTEGFDFAIPFHGAGVGVADAEAGGEGLKAGVGHFVDVADAAVGDGAHAAEEAVGVAVHLAPERAEPGLTVVEVLDDGDSPADLLSGSRSRAP